MLKMYPPAETKIPLPVFWEAILPQRGSFRSALCRYLGVENCVLAGNGRALLYLLLSALKANHPQRNEILIPGYTCYSVAASVAKAGLAIRPYDLDPQTLAPDINALKQGLSDRTLAVVVQHLFGIPAPVDEIPSLTEQAGALLIEDAAQALGGSCNGSLLGTAGDFGLYSFGRGKPLPLGSGGALIGKEADLLQAIRLNGHESGLFIYAASAAAQIFSKPCLYWIVEMLPLGLGETVFDPEFEISSINPTMEKLGRNALGRLDKLNTHRMHIAGVYQEAFNPSHLIDVPKESKPVYPRFPLMAGPTPLSSVLQRLGVRRMYPEALVDVKAIRPFLADGSLTTPGASQIAGNLLTLPTHMAISEGLARKIAEKVSRSYL